MKRNVITLVVLAAALGTFIYSLQRSDRGCYSCEPAAESVR